MSAIKRSDREKRILVIDDNPDWCNVVKMMAESLGYAVETAGSPEAAYTNMEKASKEGMPFQLAIVDVRFEIGDIEISVGREIIKTIKENYSQTACILSSGQSFSPQDVLDLRDHYGLDYYLPKIDIDRDTLNYAIVRAQAVNDELRELRKNKSPVPK